MRRIDLIVTLSALHKQPLSVPSWEVPLLVRVHSGQVQVVGESRCDMRVPDPRDEYARLLRRYGTNKETHVYRVEEVYGPDVQGAQALAAAMRVDLEEQAELDARAAGIEKRVDEAERQLPAAARLGTEPEPDAGSSKKSQRAGGTK